MIDHFNFFYNKNKKYGRRIWLNVWLMVDNMTEEEIVDDEDNKKRVS